MKIFITKSSINLYNYGEGVEHLYSYFKQKGGNRMKRILFALMLAVILPTVACAWGFDVMGYKVRSDNRLMFIHEDDNPTFLNQINYETYTHFKVREIGLFTHLDSYVNVSPNASVDIREPRTLFSASNFGDWYAWVGFGSNLGPATFEVFQVYADATNDVPTNLAIGFTF
jgi:hypothetical protein